jgi:hypothetical protein
MAVGELIVCWEMEKLDYVNWKSSKKKGKILSIDLPMKDPPPHIGSVVIPD